MPFPTQAGAPPSPAAPPAGQPVHRTTLPPPSPWAPPAGWGPPPVTAGTLLERALTIWWRNLGKLVALTLLVSAPAIALLAFVGLWRVFEAPGARAAPPEPAAFLGLFAVVFPVAAVLGLLILGAINFGVIQWLAGRPAGLGAMLGHAVRRLWRLALAGLLVMLAILGGYVLLIVPGIMVAVATCVALPAAQVEERGAMAAFQRSLELTRGHRWSIFAAFLGVLGLNFLVSLVGMALVFIPVVGVFLNLALSILTGALPYVLPAVAYHDLRVLKEGVDTSRLAQVFE